MKISDEVLTFLIGAEPIPKTVHLTWRDKGILTDEGEFPQACVRPLVELNPDWEVSVTDNGELENYLMMSLKTWGLPEHYDLIKDKQIVEKTDLWRLFKVYQEGGVYSDIDRRCNKPLSDVLTDETRMLLPTHHPTSGYGKNFAQDFMCSAPGNPIFRRAINLNISRRARGNYRSLYELGPPTFMDAVVSSMFGEFVRYRTPEGDAFVDAAESLLEECPYTGTSVEFSGVNILFDGDPSEADRFLKLKRDFYHSSGVRPWG